MAAVAAARLGRATGLLAASKPPAAFAELLTSMRVTVVAGPATLRAEHIPWTWLDAEIVLAAPAAHEIDSLMLGKFSRSLVGVITQRGSGHEGASPDTPPPSTLFPGIGALICAEHDLQAGKDVNPLDAPEAPIIVTLSPTLRVRLRWQDTWREIAPGSHVRRAEDPAILATTAAAFLIRLTETRDAVSAARFAAAAASLLPDTQPLSTDDFPTREAIIAATARSQST